MRRENVRQLLKRLSVKAGAMMLATALVIGGSVWVDYRNRTPIPELVTYVDAEGTVTIEKETVPLAAPKVTVSTKTSRKTKKIRMKKAAKRTYSKKKTMKKTATKKAVSSKDTTTTKTVKLTNVVNKYKKGSKINTQTTTVKTTVTKTVVSKASNVSTVSKPEQSTGSKPNTSTGPKSMTVEAAAPSVDKRIINAYNRLGFKIEINPKVSYAGLFDSRVRTITLKEADDTIYHELGHFLAFIAGNVDRSPAFQKVYEAEKSRYTAFNKAYVLSTPAEYFAESFKNYTQNPAELKSSRPQTYAAMASALNTVTDAHVARIADVYSVVWG